MASTRTHLRQQKILSQYKEILCLRLSIIIMNFGSTGRGRQTGDFKK
jgi:hypothetical protein